MKSIQKIRDEELSILESLTSDKTLSDQIKPYHITLTVTAPFNLRENIHDSETYKFHFSDENELRHYSNVFAGGLGKQGKAQTLILQNAALPKAGSEIIYAALKKNAELVELKVDDGFFTNQQKTTLEQLVAKRLEDYVLSRDKEPVNNRIKEKKPTKSEKYTPKNYTTNRLLYALVGGAAFGAYAFLAQFALLPAIAIGSIASLFFAFARECYINQVSKYYDTKEKIAAIKNPGEQEALKMGLASKDNSSFLWSFKSLAANQHPYAFNSGMKIGIEDNEPLKTAIKKLGTN